MFLDTEILEPLLLQPQVVPEQGRMHLHISLNLQGRPSLFSAPVNNLARTNREIYLYLPQFARPYGHGVRA
jgi:hypothetical protein